MRGSASARRSPSIGEITNPFMHPYLVAGWMRGSHWGPFMPVGLKNSKCTLFDGPPRIIGLGVQISDGMLAAGDDGKPMVVDLFDDVAFDMARQEAMQMASFMRTHGVLHGPPGAGGHGVHHASPVPGQPRGQVQEGEVAPTSFILVPIDDQAQH